MKIRITNKPYHEVRELPQPMHKKPHKPNMLFRTLLRIASIPDLLAVHFRVKKIGMEQLKKGEPCLFLMNHSSFVDLEIASTVLYPRPFNIVCTSDAFVGKNWLMEQLGCIPTKKFVTDSRLVRDMLYALHTLRSSVLMYPEASYSFDGTATPLPDTLGKCLKLLRVPVVMIRTYGAFTRDPLYNGLQRRKVRVSAEMRYLLSPQEIQEKSVDELNAILREQFTFDHFRWQRENNVRVAEPFRADYLNRVLYRCADCGTEGKMVGRGTTLTCEACGKQYELDEYGTLRAADGSTKFEYVTDWYAWERACVREELQNSTYRLDCAVDICVMVDTKHVYHVGSGRLVHTAEGFHLLGDGGMPDYKQPPLASYSLYADYYWYEVGDVICIGNQEVLYYCFPKNAGDVVAKTRIAAEELYRLKHATREK